MTDETTTPVEPVETPVAPEMPVEPTPEVPVETPPAV